MSTFADRLRRERKRVGLSPAALARAAQVPASTLYSLESGQAAAPSMWTLQRLCGALGVPMDVLIGRVN